VVLAQFLPLLLEHLFVYATGHAHLGRPRPHPDPADRHSLERCAELLGVELAANVEPYIRAYGTKVCSLTQLECQLQPEAYRRRRPRTTWAGSR
jgi:hypothetical protein